MHSKTSQLEKLVWNLVRSYLSSRPGHSSQRSPTPIPAVPSESDPTRPTTRSAGTTEAQDCCPLVIKRAGRSLVHDCNSNYRSLVDKGAKVSVFPSTHTRIEHSPSLYTYKEYLKVTFINRY